MVLIPILNVCLNFYIPVCVYSGVLSGTKVKSITVETPQNSQQVIVGSGLIAGEVMTNTKPEHAHSTPDDYQNIIYHELSTKH